MATAAQLKALIESHAKGDDARFRSVAMQIAAVAAKRGHKNLADQLVALLKEMKATRDVHVGPAKPVPIARPSRELVGLLDASYPETRLGDMVLADKLRSELELTIREYHQRGRLRAHGLVPRRRLLLVGPPGCGKTMTASALAHECGLPLMQVQLHSLITKFMGETAAKLHLVFEAVEKTPGVYLFDEFDAIGAVRGAQNDIGEIRRVLNSFLQFLERHASDSLVVAATNLRSILDDALFRRFDLVLEYELPDEASIAKLIQNRLASFTIGEFDWPRIQGVASGLCHAEVVHATEEAAKRAVLDGSETIRETDLISALKKRRRE
jgi:SpoVK/Ycf46/Vps4 family AAA+-type ATPase